MIDLHTHSNCSDGSMTPRELVRHAKENGLTAITLTDHDNTEGIDEAVKAGEEFGVDVICGVEFSTDYNGTELHILGLYIPVAYFAQVEALMEQYHRRKEQSNDVVA